MDSAPAIRGFTPTPESMHAPQMHGFGQMSPESGYYPVMWVPYIQPACILPNVKKPKSPQRPLRHFLPQNQHMHQRAAAWPEAQDTKLVVVVLTNLPTPFCNRSYVEAALEQAGLENSLKEIKINSSSGEAVVGLLGELAAQCCIAHFQGLRWGSQEKPVSARYGAAKLLAADSSPEMASANADTASDDCSASSNPPVTSAKATWTKFAGDASDNRPRWIDMMDDDSNLAHIFLQRKGPGCEDEDYDSVSDIVDDKARLSSSTNEGSEDTSTSQGGDSEDSAEQI